MAGGVLNARISMRAGVSLGGIADPFRSVSDAVYQFWGDLLPIYCIFDLLWGWLISDHCFGDVCSLGFSVTTVYNS